MKKPRNTQEAIYLIHKLEHEFHIMCAIWQTGDVLQYSQENEIPITIEEAKEAIRQLRRNYDCDAGITWDTLEYTIEDVISRRKT